MIQKVGFHYTDDITVINRQQFEAHIRLYGGYVDKINEIDQILMNNPEREKRPMLPLASIENAKEVKPMPLMG